MKTSNAILWAVAVWCAAGAFASTTKIGNADEGGDLEGLEKIEKGAIYEARAQALKLVQGLNTAGIRGLGDLSAEIEKTDLYKVKDSVQATLPEDQGAFHSNLTGEVYARTFARPHAETRFFPAADKLTREQLVALHVHEALHRALPESVRENEGAVSKITLALTAPGATHDRVRETADAVIPQPQAQLVAEAGGPVMPDPSQVGYQLRQALGKRGDSTFPEVSRIHSIYSYLYPFGDETPLGLGIEASLVEQDGKLQSGPLGLSARMRLWGARGFEIDGFGGVALNTLSSAELMNSAFGRDHYTLGISIKKSFKKVYVENSLRYSFGGKSARTVGNISYNYDFGGVVNPLVRFGGALGAFRYGVFGEMHLADHFKYSGGNFAYDTGRYRMVSMGPEVSWIEDNFMATLAGRFLLNSSKADVSDLSFLGDLLGTGVGQGGVELSIGYRF